MRSQEPLSEVTAEQPGSSGLCQRKEGAPSAFRTLLGGSPYSLKCFTNIISKLGSAEWQPPGHGSVNYGQHFTQEGYLIIKIYKMSSEAEQVFQDRNFTPLSTIKSKGMPEKLWAFKSDKQGFKSGLNI